jgi:hypothetical protein
MARETRVINIHLAHIHPNLFIPSVDGAEKSEDAEGLHLLGQPFSMAS